jgi:TetR/AcrR family transcriptional repressor of nem operon
MKHFSELSESAERVVNVAEELIQHCGYNGFSYDDIARQIGIKKPSIHHHFPSKSDLVAVVAQRYTHRFREHLLRIEGKHAGAKDRLLAYADLFQATFSKDRRLCVCGMLGAEAEALPPQVASEVQQFFEVNLDWLAAVIKVGLTDGTFRKTSALRTLAEMYLCSLEGSMVVGRGAAQSVGPAAVGRALVGSMLSNT